MSITDRTFFLFLQLIDKRFRQLWTSYSYFKTLNQFINKDCEQLGFRHKLFMALLYFYFITLTVWCVGFVYPLPFRGTLCTFTNPLLIYKKFVTFLHLLNKTPTNFENLLIQIWVIIEIGTGLLRRTLFDWLLDFDAFVPFITWS